MTPGMIHAPRVAVLAAALTALVAASQAGAQQAAAPPAGGSQLSPEQFKARCEHVIMRADVNNDGRITRQEWTDSARRIRQWLFAHGRELHGTPEKTFDTIANHEGVVTPSEVRTFCARIEAGPAAH